MQPIERIERLEKIVQSMLDAESMEDAEELVTAMVKQRREHGLGKESEPIDRTGESHNQS